MTLGEKIASARKEKGMTQEMLAEQLGVTRQAVARWETGKALPGTANLFMLRQLLGIPLEAAKATLSMLRTREHLLSVLQTLHQWITKMTTATGLALTLIWLQHLQKALA